MFRYRMNCLSPEGDGGGGGNGNGDGVRAGEKIRARVKDADSPERLLQSIGESFADFADDFEARQERKAEELGNEMLGMRQRVDDVSKLIGEIDAKRTLSAMKGRALPHFERLSSNDKVDEVCRMYAAEDEVVNF